MCIPLLKLLNGVQFGKIHVAIGRLLALQWVYEEAPAAAPQVQPSQPTAA